MKKIDFILLIFCAFSFLNLKAQNNEKELDFIIMVDEDIGPTYTSVKIKIKSKDTIEDITAQYYPGSLLLKQLDYEKLMADKTTAIYLEFTYYEYEGGNQQTYNYEIELKKPWFEDYYNILRIYNLNKKKYKQLYDPIAKDKNYTFELSSPSHTFLRVRKSSTKTK